MPHAWTSVAEHRRSLREGLAQGRLLRVPGALNPLTALLMQEIGFDGVYIDARGGVAR